MTGGQILGIELTKVQAENSHLAIKLGRKSWPAQTALTRASSGSRENFWLAFYHSYGVLSAELHLGNTTGARKILNRSWAEKKNWLVSLQDWKLSPWAGICDSIIVRLMRLMWLGVWLHRYCVRTRALLKSHFREGLVMPSCCECCLKFNWSLLNSCHIQDPFPSGPHLMYDS